MQLVPFLIPHAYSTEESGRGGKDGAPRSGGSCQLDTGNGDERACQARGIATRVIEFEMESRPTSAGIRTIGSTESRHAAAGGFGNLIALPLQKGSRSTGKDHWRSIPCALTLAW